MIFAVRAFVSRNLGPQFVHVPAFDMSACFEDSDKLKPLILVLFPGCDPLCSVYNFMPEKEEDRPQNIKVLSLGQGQGPAAEEAILEASDNGSWVILQVRILYQNSIFTIFFDQKCCLFQNCHLAEKWMERLVKVWEDQLLSDESKIHGAFRLWLTCYATPNFPSQLLQTGVKVREEDILRYTMQLKFWVLFLKFHFYLKFIKSLI